MKKLLALLLCAVLILTCAFSVFAEGEATAPSEAVTSEATETTAVAVDNSVVYASCGDLRFTVSGIFPENAVLEVTALEAEVFDFIHSNILALDALTEGYTGAAYDIKLVVDGSEIQPDKSVTVTVNGIGTTDQSDAQVYHLAGTNADDIYSAYMENSGISTFAANLSSTPIVGEQLSPINVGEDYIAFNASGFSVYYIVAGTQSDSSGNDTFYILPGTSVELTNVRDDNYTVTYPDSITAETSGASISRNGNILTFAATSSTTLGTYTIKIGSNRTATICVLSPEEMFDTAPDKKVIFTVLGNSTNVPNEPMTGGTYSNWIYVDEKNQNGYSFSSYAWGSTGVYQTSPEGFIKLNEVAESPALTQNLDGQNVIGVIDSGWGQDTLPLINMTEDDWHELLVDLVSVREISISNGLGGTVRLTATNVNEQLEDGSYRYIVYPYVVKLILDDSDNNRGWHVDCCVVDTKTYSVSYDYNLSQSLILQEGNSELTMPDRSFYTPNTTGVGVGYMKLGNTNVIGDKVVRFYDTNTLSTSEYKFLYWNTSPDGSGTSYNPGDALPPITSNVTLYAIWDHTQTSGTVKLQKTEVFEDSNDDRKDDGVSYTFTVIIANAEAGKAYPYAIYNADNTIKTQNLELVSGGTISLLGGEYAILNNVPGGAVTITENVADGSEFDVSWNVGSTTTEGNTVTATVTAGKQAEIVCINTYSPLVADLTISKTVTGTVYDMDDTFIFQLKDASGQILATFTLRNGQSVTIKDVTVGTVYTVTELDTGNRYSGACTKNITINANASENVISFTNTANETKWLSATDVVKNVFGSNSEG